MRSSRRSGPASSSSATPRCTGIPFLRLLRREVEALVKKKHGDDYLRGRQAKTELARIDRELKRLKTQVADLEERRACLLKEISRRAGAGS
jgi:hypothetical protein